MLFRGLIWEEEREKPWHTVTAASEAHAIRSTPRPTPTFEEFLSDVCDDAEIRPNDLLFPLIRGGYDAAPESVRRWVLNTAQPPASAVPFLLRALENLCDFDVFAEYGNWLRGQPYLKGIRKTPPA